MTDSFTKEREASRTPAALCDRITGYLSGGGLYNPELANHEAVRDLLIDCRDAIQSMNPPSEDEALQAAADALVRAVDKCRQPLSAEKINEIIEAMPKGYALPFTFARAIESAHGIGDRDD